MDSFLLVIEGGGDAGRELCVHPARPCTLGRSPASQFRLPDDDPRASRRHAILEVVDRDLRVQDLGSKNGTWVNGARITTPVVLRPGDRLRAGRTVLLFSRVLDGAATVLLPAGAPTPLPEPSLTPSHSNPPSPSPSPSPSPPDGAGAAEVATFRSDSLSPCDGCGRIGPTPAADRLTGAGWLCDACAHDRTRRDPGEPERVAGYDLLRVAERGGIATVYEARHLATRAHVALKILLLPFASDPTATRRFLREQRLTLDLTHPRLVRAFDLGHDERNDRVFLVGEWLEGGDARALASASSDVGEVLRLGADLFDALGYLHAMGLTHRDVRPENLKLVGRVGQRGGKLGDFGLRKNLRESGSLAIDRDLDGAPLFLAPEELARVKRVGPRADLYGAMATLYFVLAGRSPLVLPDEGAGDLPTVAVLAAILADDRLPLADVRPDVPRDLAAWIDRGLLRNPVTRDGLHAGAIAERLRREAAALA